MNTFPQFRGALALAVACGLMAASQGAQAQPDNQPATPSPLSPEPPAAPGATPPATPASGATGDARDALKKQAGDVDQSTLLKDTLTKTERQYSLLRAGRIASNYDFNYSYIGSEAIDEGFDTSGSIDLFKIETTRAHTITNTFSMDYGLMDNLTVTGTLPFVSKFTQGTTYSGIANGIGDLSLGARFQPFSLSAGGGPTFTFTSQVSLPTGRSPFRTAVGSNLSTGSGFATGTVGVNASAVMDPVALFGSFSVGASRNVVNLNQEGSDGSVLTAVHPGKSIGFGAGFTYALSYNVSTSVSFQENVTTASQITYIANGATTASQRGTAMQVAALLNFGLGVRLNPKTTVNLSAGIGLTTDSPDFSLGLNLPLTFSLF